MNNSFEFKEAYGIEDLLRIMALLRSPEGCPWDREQTHASIKKNFIEETYEVVEAINKNDPVLLCEELGDVLLQIVFHAQMEEEAGRFAFAQVADGICKKLIERHPHVFGDRAVANSAEVLDNWDRIKRASKQQKTASEAMDAVPRELPALMRATKIQAKAKKVGFDWPDVNGAMDKLREETAELAAAIAGGTAQDISEELGDVLFSAVNVSRFVDVDAEEAMTAATDKFFVRFCRVEAAARDAGQDMREMSLADLDMLWEKAKQEGL